MPTPLSLTWRQYRELIALIDHLSAISADMFRAAEPVRRHIAQVVRRHATQSKQANV